MRVRSGQLSGIHIERVTRKDLVLFTSQLIPVVATGVPLLAGLEDLEQSMSKERLKGVVRGLRAGIERGDSLADSMARYPSIFSDIYINTVRAGEESGKLEEALVELRDFLEWQLDLRQRVRNILAYPMIVVVALIALNVVIVTVAIPRFQQAVSPAAEHAGFRVAVNDTVRDGLQQPLQRLLAADPGGRARVCDRLPGLGRHPAGPPPVGSHETARSGQRAVAPQGELLQVRPSLRHNVLSRCERDSLARDRPRRDG